MSKTTSPTHGRVAGDKKAGKPFGRLQTAYRVRAKDGPSQYHEPVNVAKPRFCEVIKGERQEPVAV